MKNKLNLKLKFAAVTLLAVTLLCTFVAGITGFFGVFDNRIRLADAATNSASSWAELYGTDGTDGAWAKFIDEKNNGGTTEFSIEGDINVPEGQSFTMTADGVTLKLGSHNLSGVDIEISGDSKIEGNGPAKVGNITATGDNITIRGLEAEDGIVTNGGVTLNNVTGDITANSGTVNLLNKINGELTLGTGAGFNADNIDTEGSAVKFTKQPSGNVPIQISDKASGSECFSSTTKDWYIINYNNRMFLSPVTGDKIVAKPDDPEKLSYEYDGHEYEPKWNNFTLDATKLTWTADGSTLKATDANRPNETYKILNIKLKSGYIWADKDYNFVTADEAAAITAEWEITQATPDLKFKYNTSDTETGESTSRCKIEFETKGTTAIPKKTGGIIPAYADSKTQPSTHQHSGQTVKTVWENHGTNPNTLKFSTTTGSVISVDETTGTITHNAKGQFSVTVTVKDDLNFKDGTYTTHGELTAALLDLPWFYNDNTDHNRSLTYKMKDGVGEAQNHPQIRLKTPQLNDDGSVKKVNGVTQYETNTYKKGDTLPLNIKWGGETTGTNIKSDYKLTLTTDGNYIWKTPEKSTDKFTEYRSINDKNGGDSTVVTMEWSITKVLMIYPTLSPDKFMQNAAMITFNAMKDGTLTLPKELTETTQADGSAWYVIKTSGEEDLPNDSDPLNPIKMSVEESKIGTYYFTITINDAFFVHHAFKDPEDTDKKINPNGVQVANIIWSITIEKKNPQIYYEGTIRVGDTESQKLGVTDDSGGNKVWSITSGGDRATIDASTGIIYPVHAGTVEVSLVIGAYGAYPEYRIKKSVTIEPFLVTKPTLKQDSFTYTPDGISLMDAGRYNNFNTSYMEVDTSVSGYNGINVSDYEVQIKLKGNTNTYSRDYVWGDDNTTAPIKLKWHITKAKFTPKIVYGVSSGNNDDTSALDDIYVGFPTERFRCINYPNEGTPVITWSMGGSSGGNAGSASINSSTGVMTPGAAGAVTIVVTVSGYRNYEDGTTSKTVTIKALTKLTVPTVKADLTYNGSTQSPSFNNYSSSSTVVILGGVTSAKDVGDKYTAIFSINEADKKRYIWNTGDKDDKPVTWKIVPRIIQPQFYYQSGSTQENHVVFGTDAEAFIVSDGDVIKSYADLSGSYKWSVKSSGGTADIDSVSGVLKPTQVGDVEVTLEVVNYSSNYTVDPYSAIVKIDLLQISVPTKKTNGTSMSSPDFTYNVGKQLTLEFNNFSDKWLAVSGHVASVAGSYTAKVNLRDKKNTYWGDSAGGVGERTFNWWVGRATVQADAISITYGVIIFGSDSGTPVVDGDVSGGVRTWCIVSGNTLVAENSIASIASDNGVITPKLSNNLTVRLSIAQTDNYFAVSKDCTVFIHKKAIEVPRLEGTYTWIGLDQTTGLDQTVAFSKAYVDEIMTRSGALTRSAANATLEDKYSVTVSFKGDNGSKYRWDDVEETDNTASTGRTLYWRIERAELELPTLSPEALPYSTGIQTTELSYIQYLSIVLPSVSGIGNFTRPANSAVITVPAGTPVKDAAEGDNFYPIKVTPDSNHRWAGEYDVSEKTLKFTVTRAAISLNFSYAESIIYGKDSVAPNVTGDLGNGVKSWSITNVTGSADIDRFNGMILKPGSIGDVSVTLTVGATRNYQGGTVNKTVTVEKATYTDDELRGIVWVYDFDKDSTNDGNNYIYNGTNYTVSIRPEGLPRDMVITEYEGNVGNNAGSYTASVKSFTWNSNYNKPTIPGFTWNIQKANINGNVVNGMVINAPATLKIDDAVAAKIIYNGGLQKPAYSVTFLDMKAEDYTESWANNINAGVNTARLTITVNGDSKNFTGTKSINFSIKKADYVTDGLAWNYDANSPFVYNGSERTVELVNLPVNVSGIPIGVTYTENGTYTHRRTNANESGYTAQAIFTPDPNYNNISSMTLVWKIMKANYDMSGVKWDYEGPFTYDGNNHRVQLLNEPLQVLGLVPTYVTNNNSNVKYIARDVGTYIAQVSFSDSGYNHINYNRPTVPDLEWEIKQAPYDASNLAWDYTGKITYDGQNHSVKVANLPDDLTATYGGDWQNIKNAGVYTATVTFTCKNSNYAAPELQALVWKIDKASYDMTGVIWNYTSPFTYATTSFLDPSKGVSTYSVALSALPKGKVAADNLATGKVTYKNASASEAGTYTASVTFDYDDTNYLKPSVPNLVWKINRQSIDMPYTVGSLTYNGSSQSPSGIISGYKTLADAVAAANKIADLAALSIEGDTAGTIAGKYTTTFKFKGPTKDNYQWSDGTTDDLSVTWYINKAHYDLSGVEWNYDEAFTYNGQPHTITIKADTLPLKNPAVTDRVSVLLYSDNSATNAGTYFANVKTFDYDKANYYAPELKNSYEWVINKADISNATLNITTSADKIVYTGLQIQPAYSISYLTLSRSDYDVVWSNNINAGKATLTLVARNDTSEGPGSLNFIGTIYVNFIIKQAKFDMSKVEWYAVTDLVYDGNEKSVELRGLPAGIKVKEDKGYSENVKIEAGDYVATALLEYDTKNYELVTVDNYKWSISKALLTKPSVDGTYYYDRAQFTVGNKDSSHNVVLAGYDETTMRLSGQLSGLNADDYKITVSVKNPKNYEWADTHTADDLEIEWTIEKGNIDLSNAVWNYSSAIPYDGKEHSVTINGLPDYIGVTYYGNIAIGAGLYRASVSFSYSASNYNEVSFPSCDWEILKADISNAQLTITTAANTIIYTGFEWRPTYSINYLTLNVNDYTAEYNNNVRAGEASLTVKVNSGNANFEGSKTVYFTILKADFDIDGVSWNYSTPFTYNGDEKSVALQNVPAGLKVMYSGETATNAGKDYTATATFVFDDVLDGTLDENHKYSLNYNLPEFNKVCKWEISRATYDMTKVVWDYKPSYVYDGSAQSVNIVSGLPDGVNVVEYENYVYVDGSTRKVYTNVATNAGTYYAKVEKFTYDRVNYNAPVLPVYEWLIDKADYDMTGVAWDYNSVPFTYDGTKKKVSVTGLPVGVTVSEYLRNEMTDAGTYEARVIDLNFDSDNYRRPEFTKPCNWEIAKADLKNAKLAIATAANEIIYTGSELQPEYTLSYLTAIAASEYEAVWTNNIDASAADKVARLTLTAKPTSKNFTGTVFVEFRILKATFDMSGVSWDYTNPLEFNGQTQYVYLKDLPEGIKGVTYVGNSGDEVGTYVASVEDFEYDVNYNAPVFNDTCVWEISRKDVAAGDIVWRLSDGAENPTYYSFDDTIYFDGKTAYVVEAVVTLNGVEYKLPVMLTKNGINQASALNAGAYTAIAVSDETFNLIESVSEEFIVNKLPVNAGEVTWKKGESADSGNFTNGTDFVKMEFDGKNHAPYAFISVEGTMYGLPVALTLNGVSATSAINAGSYVATALTGENFAVIEVETISFEITKKEVESVTWSIADNTEITFDGTDKMPAATVEYNGKTYNMNVNLSMNGNRVLTAIDAGSYSATVTDGENFVLKTEARISFFINPIVIEADDVMWDTVNNSVFTYNGKNLTPTARYVHDGVVYELPVTVSAVTRDSEEDVNKAVNAGNYVAKVAEGGNFEINGESFVTFEIEKFGVTADDVEWSFDEGAHFAIGEMPFATAFVRIGGKEYALAVNFEKVGGSTEGWTEGAYIATVSPVDGENNIALVGAVTRSFQIADDVANSYGGATVGNEDGNAIWWLILLGFDALVFAVDLAGLIIAIIKYRKSKRNEKASAGTEPKGKKESDDLDSSFAEPVTDADNL